MFLIVTRNFPPDIGGIQALIGGLSESLLEHGPVKIFADAFDNSQLYDNKTAANITRVKGIKLFKKFRKEIMFIRKYLKWISTFLVLTGILLTNLNIYPLNIYFHGLGVIGWTIAGFISKDKAILTNFGLQIPLFLIGIYKIII